MVIYHGRKDHTSLGHALDRPNHLDGSLSTWMKSRSWSGAAWSSCSSTAMYLFHTSSKSSPKMMQAYISGSTCVNSASPFSCSSGLACLFLQALTFSSGLIPAVFAIFSVPLPDWSQVSWVWMLQVLHGVVFFRVVAESSKYSSRDREGAWLQDVDHLLIQMRVLADTSSSNDMFEVLRTPWSSPWRSTATWSLSRTGSWVTPSQWPPTRR